ncbi:MFS transporter [Microlunatus sp. GCM10028923]|uniref:MFS transporter n=1 Tax=Microlunatus sp. GCM10028923 TaxID=3273400 RepID=UPI003617F9BF
MADRYPKRRILLISYGGGIPLAVLLAGLTLTQLVQAWQVMLIAVGFGVIDASVTRPGSPSALSWSARPSSGARSASVPRCCISAGWSVRPWGGVLISTAGTGWSFLVAAGCFAVPLVVLILIRTSELHLLPRAPIERGGLVAGLRGAISRPDVLWPTLLIGLFGMFTSSLTVTLAVYAHSVFHSGPGGYGLLTTIVAVGSLSGALIAGRLRRTRLRTLMAVALVLAALYVVGAATPSEFAFWVILFCIGAGTLLLSTSANSTVQLAAPDGIRGRVVSVFFLVYFGSATVGGPLLGSVVQQFGPSGGMVIAGALPGIGTLLIMAIMLVHRLCRHRDRGVASDLPLRRPDVTGD